MQTQKSTYYVKNNSLVLNVDNELTFYVKTMDTKSNSQKFALWLDGIIRSCGLTGKAVAEKAHIKPGSLSRMNSGGAGIKKETAIALMNAVNEMTGKNAAEQSIGLAILAGLDLPIPPKSVAEFAVTLKKMGVADWDIPGIDLEKLPPEALAQLLDVMETNVRVQLKNVG
jgi:hypothetical protein